MTSEQFDRVRKCIESVCHQQYADMRVIEVIRSLERQKKYASAEKLKGEFNIKCKCINCKKQYDPYKSRAYYAGYCSQKCLRAKAKECGYRRHQTEYSVLKNAGLIGNVYLEPKD